MQLLSNNRFFSLCGLASFVILLTISACAGETSDPAGTVPLDPGSNNSSANNSSANNSTTNNSTDQNNQDVDENNSAPTNNNNNPEEPQGSGSIAVNVETLLFEDYLIGETGVQTVQISNVGTGNLRIDSLRINQLYGGHEESEFSSGSLWIEPLTIIEPYTYKDIEVQYSPKTYDTAQGVLEIRTNDPDNPLITVRLETINAYPDMEAPGSVRFGTVDPGNEAREQIAIYNRGIDPLEILGLETSHPDIFAMEFPTQNPIPAMLPQHHYIVFDVVYMPETPAVDRGTITVTSTDPDDSPYYISLIGNGATPCLSVGSAALDFNPQSLNQTVSQNLTILNCSGVESLSIQEFQLVDDAGGIFTIQNQPSTPLSLSARSNLTVTINARLTSNYDAAGFLRVVSDDPEQEEVFIVLRIHKVPGI